MKFAFSVWVVAFSFCEHARAGRRGLPNVTLAGLGTSLVHDVANSTLENTSSASGGAEIVVALGADATLPMNHLHVQPPSNPSVSAQPQQKQSDHSLPQEQMRRLRLHSHSADHGMTISEQVDMRITHYVQPRNQSNHPSPPTKVHRLSLHGHSAHHQTKISENVATTHNELHKGEHDKRQSTLLEVWQSDAGKLGMASEGKNLLHDFEQPKQVSRLSVDTGHYKVHDAKYNQFFFSEVMSSQPHLPAGALAAICLAVVLMLLWICSCCLYAQIFFSHRGTLEDSRSRGSSSVEGSAEGREERTRAQSNASQKSTSSRGEGKIASVISKGKRARGASEAEKYRFGDLSRGLLVAGK